VDYKSNEKIFLLIGHTFGLAKYHYKTKEEIYEIIEKRKKKEGFLLLTCNVRILFLKKERDVGPKSKS